MDTQILISEFIGTAVLMAFGSGVNSSVLLKNTLAKAFAPNWMSLIFGWGLAVTFAVYIGIALGGPAHLNPAITISFAAGGLFPWDQVLPVVAAQMLGGFVGSAITMIHYFPHFKQTGPDEGNVVGIFATGPMSDNRFMNLLSEVIATFMFILAILCLGKMSDGLFPFIVGMLVASIGFPSVLPPVLRSTLRATLALAWPMQSYRYLTAGRLIGVTPGFLLSDLSSGQP